MVLRLAALPSPSFVMGLTKKSNAHKHLQLEALRTNPQGCKPYGFASKRLPELTHYFVGS